MLRCMRTTLTLEDDVAARVAMAMERNKSTLKELVNSALRVGLDAMEKPAPQPKPFKVIPYQNGQILLPSLDDISEVLSIIEGEDHK